MGRDCKRKKSISKTTSAVQCADIYRQGAQAGSVIGQRQKHTERERTERKNIHGRGKEGSGSRSPPPVAPIDVLHRRIVLPVGCTPTMSTPLPQLHTASGEIGCCNTPWCTLAPSLGRTNTIEPAETHRPGRGSKSGG